MELAIDVVYINDQSFLHAIDRTIKLRGIAHLGTRKKGEAFQPFPWWDSEKSAYIS